MSKKLYALIVGINDYQYVTKLGGCVNDAKRIHAYFKKVTQKSDFEYYPKLLLDADATKQNIEAAFKHHLSKAGEGDVVVYYFSGHGAQEKADEVWLRNDSDGALETQVCYDSRDRNGTPDLADKELRYLIHQVSLNKPHIVVISDSCHSGDNTRTDLVKRRLPDMEAVGEPRLSNLAPMRSWDKFCFTDEISRADVANELVLENILPQGQHIQMSACMDRELAYEMQGSGIFTSMLLNVLERSNGNISYADLHQRIRYSITGKYPQVPTIYTSDGDGTRLHQAFLGGAAVKEPFYYNVQRNYKGTIGWTLSIGAIHGVPTNLDANIIVEIRDTNDKSVVITTATISTVEPGMTRLAIQEEEKLDKETQYFATIPQLFVNPVRVYIHGNEEGKQVLKEEMELDEDFKYSNLAITDDLVLADYLVYAKRGSTKDYYYIGNPTNDLSKLDENYVVKSNGKTISYPYWKPLTERQKDFTSGSAKEIIKFLKAASNWTFLLKLDNSNTQLSNHGIKLDVYQLSNETDIPTAEKLVQFEEGKALLNYTTLDNQPKTYFYIKVTNDSNRTYRVALPALFPAFEVYSDTLAGGVVEIQPRATKLAFNGTIASIHQPDFEKNNLNDSVVIAVDWIKDFNWHHKSIWLKLIVSTDDFSINDFARAPVPYPKNNRGLMDVERSKGFGNIGATSKPVMKTDWTTDLFEIQLLNPFYISPPEEFA